MLRLAKSSWLSEMSSIRFRAAAVNPTNGADLSPRSQAGKHSPGLIPISYGQAGAVFAAIDFFSIAIVSLLSGEIYNYIVFRVPSNANYYLLIGILSSAAFVSTNHLQGRYQPSTVLYGNIKIKTIVANWIIAIGIVLIVAFFGKVSNDYSRGAATVFFFATALALPLCRIAAQYGLRFFIANGYLNDRRRILLLGSTNQLADGHVFNDLRRHGYGIEDQIGVRISSTSLIEQARAISSAVGRLKQYVRQNRIDEIFLSFDSTDTRALDLIVEQLRSVPIPVRLLFDRRMSNLLSTSLNDLGTIKAVRVQRGPLTTRQQMLKRALDVTLSLVALFFLAPVFVMIAIAISMDSSGPVMFRQRRAGFSGRIFRIYKFRSMTSLDDGNVVVQATRNDQRVTRVGRILRKTSLDELPQLLNVLQGDMSLVGPRPHALSHDNEYNKCIATYALRHHMKPGITGWAQINGFRGETSTIRLMEQRVEHDLWYIGHWSAMLDIKVMFLTVLQVIFPKNVY
jgi:Undecaprenyl-phosphate glucose phosphotransferase